MYDPGDSYKNAKQNIFQKNISEPWKVEQILAMFWLKTEVDEAVDYEEELLDFRAF